MLSSQHGLTKTNIRKLFAARAFASLLLLAIFYWFESYAGEQTLNFLVQLMFLWLALLTIQVVVFRFSSSNLGHVLIQLIADLVLIGFVIFGSGGLNSPFIFLLGLVIITAGSQAHILLTLTTAVLAAAAYLLAIYMFEDIRHVVIPPESTLKILLQTSLFFLTGGIMALIASRHARLQEKEQVTSVEHQQLKAIHNQVLDVMHEGIVVLDTALTVQSFNPSAATLLGLSAQHTGFKIDSFIHLPDELHNAPKKVSIPIIQHEVQHQNHHLLLTFKKLNIEHDSLWLMTIVNVTETRKLERKLAEKDKLAHIGQMSAMLAHEIRNPMQTISQAAELMGLNQQDSKLERMITEEISRLNRLVSDMLDYASPLHPKPKMTNISSLISSSVQQIDLSQSLNITVNCDDIEADLDPDHFRLILDNLLRNAVRVSPEPASIYISFEQHKTNWSLRVHDHGQGIDESVKDTLFQPFKTGHKHGTGLGLATVYQVCLINQWQVYIDKGITDGACFVVECTLGSTNIEGESIHG